MSEDSESRLSHPAAAGKKLELELSARIADHAARAASLLARLEAPEELLDGVRGQAELGVISEQNRSSYNFRRYYALFAEPLAEVSLTLEDIDREWLSQLLLNWFGVDQVVRQAAQRHIGAQLSSVASYTDWQDKIVKPRLDRIPTDLLPTQARGQTQFESAYYSHIRVAAYAAGIGLSFLRYELGDQYPTTTVDNIQDIQLRKYLERVSDKDLQQQANALTEHQASAFAFDDVFIIDTHRQYVEQE
ncbi:MAG: hypothetical protein WD467_03465 [Candidatus Saccharimonadales bacterium]